jgi:hypothetical protein
MLRSRSFTLVLGAMVSLALGACQAVAGLEDRELDPAARPSPNPASAECQSYCDTVMDVCTGDNAVYTTPELCLGVCAQLDPGDPIEPVGNTLACRVQEAKSAEREPADHCRFLGPGGGGKCGSDCDAYCDLFPKVCPDEVEYPTKASCLKACGGLTDQDRFDVKADHGGDSIECRLVHLSSATVKPDEHCAHAPIPPTEPWCTGAADEAPTCEQYCKIELAACDGELKQYVDEQQCLDVCATFAPGTNDDQTGNTVGCRRYHAFSATLAAETHCSHSGPTGDGHCGDHGKVSEGTTGNCESYCALVAEVCPDEFEAEMLSAEQCMTKCVALDEAAADSKYSLSNAQKSKGLSCRILHAANAFADPTSCAAALGAAPCDG